MSIPEIRASHSTADQVLIVDRAPARPGSRRSRSVAFLVLALAALFAPIVVLSLATGGPATSAEPEHVATATPITLVPGQRLVQPLRTTAPGLAEVDLTFGTFGGTSRCTLDVVLQQSGQEVAHRRLDCAGLPDTVPVAALRFPPRKAPAGTPL